VLWPERLQPDHRAYNVLTPKVAARGNSLKPLRHASVLQGGRYYAISVFAAIANIFCGSGVVLGTQTDVNGLNGMIHRGDYSSVEQVLKTGIDPDQTDSNGISPLSLAAMQGNISLVKLLILYHANRVVNPWPDKSSPVIWFRSLSNPFTAILCGVKSFILVEWPSS
jgi:hypothetical protein